jgi:uncharacterized protein
MKYSFAPLPDWDRLDGSLRIQVARHYRVPIEDADDLLVVPHGRPGWLRFPAAMETLLDALDGAEVGELRAREKFADIAAAVREWYEGGLLFIGGRTGLRAEATGGDDAAAEPPSALLLKLTGACDMACRYCYDYDARRWPGRMSTETARRLIVECLRPRRRLTLMFHGGEPMLRFAQIRELVDFAGRRAADVGASVHFSVQTNGLHFSDPIVEFLRAHRFSVGVSLDGPAKVHDRNRVDHGGRGTFERIAENFARFPRFMRDEVGYISVVGYSDDLADIDAAWRFFRDLGVHTWKLLPADPEGRASGTPKVSGFGQVFVDFLATRLDAVLRGAIERPYITNLVQLIEPFLSIERPNMCMKMPCGAAGDLLVLDATGEIRACDCTDHPLFRLLPGEAGAAAPAPGAEPGSGSAHRSLPLVEIRTTRPPAAAGPPADPPAGGLVERSRATASVRALRERERWLLHRAPCAACPWLHQCAGTCPAKALMSNGSLLSIDALECATRLTLFPRILGDVSRPGSRLREYHDLAKRRTAARTLDAASGAGGLAGGAPSR